MVERLRRSQQGGGQGMMVLALVQVAAAPTWVGPTMAISLAVIALSILCAGVAVGIVVLRLSGQVKKMGAVVEGLQDDVTEGVTSIRRLIEQGQDLMVLVRHE